MGLQRRFPQGYLTIVLFFIPSLQIALREVHLPQMYQVTGENIQWYPGTQFGPMPSFSPYCSTTMKHLWYLSFYARQVRIPVAAFSWCPKSVLFIPFWDEDFDSGLWTLHVELPSEVKMWCTLVILSWECRSFPWTRHLYTMNDSPCQVSSLSWAELMIVWMKFHNCK